MGRQDQRKGTMANFYVRGKFSKYRKIFKMAAKAILKYANLMDIWEYCAIAVNLEGQRGT